MKIVHWYIGPPVRLWATHVEKRQGEDGHESFFLCIQVFEFIHYNINL